MRRFLVLAALPLALALSACDDHGHDTVSVNGARVELLSASGTVLQALTITPSTAPSAPLSIGRGVPATIRVTWLDASGASDPANNDADFVVRITPPSGSGLAFSLATGSRSTGTLTGSTLQATAVQVPLSLFHTKENHSDLDVNIPVVVVTPTT